MPRETSHAAFAPPPLLVLGQTLCGLCRSADAELVLDAGERWERPACAGCVDDLLERDRARAVSPEIADRIRWAREDVRWRPLPRPKEPGMIW